mgnify:CR=1 FL=1
MCTWPDRDSELERLELTLQKAFSLQFLGKTPLLELFTSAVIVGFHALVFPKLRIVSDALFLEGVTLSVVGAFVAIRVSEDLAFSSFRQKKHQTAARSEAPVKHRLLRSLLKRRNGLRILFIGLALIGAAIVIGELFVRPAG